MLTIITIAAIAAVAIAVGKATECRGLRRRLHSARKDSVNLEQAYHALVSAINDADTAYHIEDTGKGCFSVVKWYFHEDDDYPISIVARSYRFDPNDPEDEAYALRCAEELVDKLNESEK